MFVCIHIYIYIYIFTCLNKLWYPDRAGSGDHGDGSACRLRQVWRDRHQRNDSLRRAQPPRSKAAVLGEARLRKDETAAHVMRTEEQCCVFL